MSSSQHILLPPLSLLFVMQSTSIHIQNMVIATGIISIPRNGIILISQTRVSRILTYTYCTTQPSTINNAFKRTLSKLSHLRTNNEEQEHNRNTLNNPCQQSNTLTSHSVYSRVDPCGQPRGVWLGAGRGGLATEWLAVKLGTGDGALNLAAIVRHICPNRHAASAYSRVDPRGQPRRGVM